MKNLPNNDYQCDRRGVILPLVAVLLSFLMIMVVFFVDVAYMQLTRTQLQAASDAAAKAACQSIAGGGTADDIKQVAIDIAAMNEVGGQPLVLVPEDVLLGASTEQSDGTWLFQEKSTNFTAVAVNGIKGADSASGPVNLFFAGAIGMGSFEPMKRAEASQLHHEVVLAIDRSHSMCFDFTGDDWSYPNSGGSGDDYCKKPHPANSRWAALFTGVNAFLNIVENSPSQQQQSVSLVTWGSDITETSCSGTVETPASQLEASLGNDFQTMRSKMVALGNDTMHGGTNMSAGLDAAIGELIGANSVAAAKKTIILFTDGQWNAGVDPATRATIAKNSNITIHVVSLLANLDMTEMDAIASTTGGVHYNASTEQELVDAFKGLARSLPVVLTK